MLYLFQSKQVETVREVSAVLGKSEATIHRWLFQYIAFLRKMRYNITDLNKRREKYRTSKCYTALIKWGALRAVVPRPAAVTLNDNYLKF